MIPSGRKKGHVSDDAENKRTTNKSDFLHMGKSRQNVTVKSCKIYAVGSESPAGNE